MASNQLTVSSINVASDKDRQHY